jgi:hypothetical protein
VENPRMRVVREHAAPMAHAKFAITRRSPINAQGINPLKLCLELVPAVRYMLLIKLYPIGVEYLNYVPLTSSDSFPHRGSM